MREKYVTAHRVLPAPARTFQDFPQARRDAELNKYHLANQWHRSTSRPAIHGASHCARLHFVFASFTRRRLTPFVKNISPEFHCLRRGNHA
jgi:hypothetical protein